MECYYCGMKKPDMALASAVTTSCAILLLFLLGRGTSASGGSELEALLVFKHRYLSNAIALSSWDELDASPCRWKGVRCNGTSGKVTALNLDGLSLNGRISGTLADLSGLEILSLARNNLSGLLPDEITQMPTLKKLNASYNCLSGSIPSLFSATGKLEHLDLSFNALTGQIPPQLFSSNRNLRTIALSGNQLWGKIPSSMTECYLLQRVNVSGNKISGPLSERLGHLRNLQMLDLSWNGLGGGIPLGISALRYLIELRLPGNSISGQIPRGLTHCENLLVLDLSFNDMTGSLPSQLQILSGLTVLNLRKNYLSGTIPAWISSLMSLEILDLADNMFSGSLPSSLGLLRGLRTCSLSGNSISGRIPDGLGNLQLSVLDLSHNQLSGSIPSRLITRSLHFLSLSHNLLSGGVSLGDCKSLQVLDLSRNLLTGKWPAQVGGCSALAVLNVSDNSLSSSLPVAIGGVTSLKVLDISRNWLTGAIPNNLCSHTRLRILRVDHNRLAGSIPVELEHCSWLQELSASSNYLQGAIPRELANVTGLEDLDLSNNRLSGSIPAELAHLRNLVTVNVSHNLLHGPIPDGIVFNSMNRTAYASNSGLCGSAINVTCAQPIPAAISPAGRGQQLPPSGTERGRVLLSVSAIIAISAAASIAVGAIALAGNSLRATKGSRCSTIRMGSMPDRSSRVLTVGRLFMFSRKRWFRSRSWLPNDYLLLHKHSEIGHGEFGVVYQVAIPDGQTVAVKKLVPVSGSAKSREEFEREVRLLGKVRHPNLVQVEGYYWTEQVQLLLRTYIPRGDLGSRLHERGQGQPILDWPTRFKIARGTALGLAHLHQCNPQIIHYNVKASNILLDVGNTPRISDFGVFKLVPMLDTVSMSSIFQNALGYKAPEFASDVLQIDEKSDVYGFGVVLLELVTGRRPVEYMDEDVVLTLSDFVRSMLEQSQALACVDPDLNLHDNGLLLPCLKLGVICTSHASSQRPSMMEVVDMLELMNFNPA